ncbi:MAG TPA: alpha/beta fold hydrolase [Verrucomicrobiales bacterium]|nr:alpha/beta fold hydrolase [Verrucomicrobiales bacterium]
MLNHITSGRGAPVVLIHAFPLCHDMWRPQMRQLSQHGLIVAPDLPGFGESPRQAKPSIPGMAREVAGLLDGLKIQEPAIVCGLSMGGYVTFEFLRQFPERVRALGLFSTRAAADTPEAREGRFKTAEKIRADGLEPFAKSILPKLLGKSSMSQSNLVEQLTAMILANEPEGVAGALLAMAGRADSTSLLEEIKVPALVAAGEEDSFIPPEESEQMAASIDGAQFSLIKTAGHLINMEDPASFTQALERFVVSVAHT